MYGLYWGRSRGTGGSTENGFSSVKGFGSRKGPDCPVSGRDTHGTSVGIPRGPSVEEHHGSSTILSKSQKMEERRETVQWYTGGFEVSFETGKCLRLGSGSRDYQGNRYREGLCQGKGKPQETAKEWGKRT